MVTHATLIKLHRLDQKIDDILDDGTTPAFIVERTDLEKLHELIKIVITDQLQGE